MDFLYQQQLNVYREKLQENMIEILWNGREINNSLEIGHVTMNEYLCDDEVAKSVVKSLIKYGIAFIEKVPANIQSTELVIKRLFPIKHTHLGELFFINKSQLTENSMIPHTETAYLDDAAGLVAMHCIQQPTSGGETYLIDGFNVLNSILTQNSSIYERLTQSVVTTQFIDDEHNYQYSGPLVRLNSLTSVVQQIRFDPTNFAPHPIPVGISTNEFYSDLRLLSKEIHKPENRWVIQLAKGTVILFNNWRILHGWHAYKGKRSVCCAFISYSDFISKARNMNLLN